MTRVTDTVLGWASRIVAKQGEFERFKNGQENAILWAGEAVAQGLKDDFIPQFKRGVVQEYNEAVVRKQTLIRQGENHYRVLQEIRRDLENVMDVCIVLQKAANLAEVSANEVATHNPSTPIHVLPQFLENIPAAPNP